MPTAEVDFFVGQLDDEKEAWQEDHARAMQCRDLESLLRKGLTFFYMIRTADESWSEKVQSGKVAFNAATARKLRAAYDWWLLPCDRVEACVRTMEKYFEVEKAEDFRNCFRLARNITSIDINSVITSVQQMERGEVADMTEEDWGGLPSSTHVSGGKEHSRTAKRGGRKSAKTVGRRNRQ